VQPDRDRDRAVDRTLRQTLRASASEPLGEHVDGETLAAWTEGQLRSNEAARVEQHLADCARCQQLLATFARTSPPPVLSEPLWRRWRLQWLVPIATAATVAALWVAAPQQPSRVERPIADQVTPASPSTPAENEAARSIASPSTPTTAKQEARQVSEPPAAKSADAKTLAAPPPAAPAPSTSEKREDSESVRRDALGAVSAPQAGATAAPEADARQRDEQARGKLAETIQVTPETPAAQAPAAQARAVAPAPSAAPTPLPRAANAARALGTSAFSPQPDIVSPNAAMRWRIVAGNRIERSTNGGGEWQAATVPSPGVFTAGTSPAPSICWIVGRGGVVYVTTDGLRFTRVMSPESIDLVSVTATDERHATVISADGRSFRTDDQGKSWTR
jgi:Putative zinc-finger